MNSRLRDILYGKRVAIVGPSRSIVGSHFGHRIDSYDLVVRINHQWPIRDELQVDVGQRMDGLYHCCNGDYPISQILTHNFEQTKFVCFEHGLTSDELIEECEVRSIPVFDVTNEYQKLSAAIGTHPNTGCVAIMHLLSQPIVELGLFGITFFREQYYTGYQGDGSNAEFWQNGTIPVRIWEHDLPRQYEYFEQIYRLDSRIKIDEISLPILFDSNNAWI